MQVIYWKTPICHFYRTDGFLSNPLKRAEQSHPNSHWLPLYLLFYSYNLFEAHFLVYVSVFLSGEECCCVPLFWLLRKKRESLWQPVTRQYLSHRIFEQYLLRCPSKFLQICWQLLDIRFYDLLNLTDVYELELFVLQLTYKQNQNKDASSFYHQLPETNDTQFARQQTELLSEVMTVSHDSFCSVTSNHHHVNLFLSLQGHLEVNNCPCSLFSPPVLFCWRKRSNTKKTGRKRWAWIFILCSPTPLMLSGPKSWRRCRARCVHWKHIIIIHFYRFGDKLDSKPLIWWICFCSTWSFSLISSIKD